MSRPEHLAPPEIYYGETEARKYTQNSHIADVQARLTHRALELLALPGHDSDSISNIDNSPAFVLDVGCGSGLSGEVIEEYGYAWVGVDIAPAMLDVANERELEGDLFLHDIGQGFGFRPGTFDGVISISVLQWLCNSDTKAHNPRTRLSRFFTTLYTAMARGARAVFQFYPDNDLQVQLIISAALKAGFTGGIVIDYPNSTKARKSYLVLSAGQRDTTSNKNEQHSLPRGLSGGDNDEELDEAGFPLSIRYASGRTQDSKRRRGKSGIRKNAKDKDWIQHKKEQTRAKGDKKVAKDSKYTGRKRGPKF